MKKERDEECMAVLATPKKNSYIVKKDYTSKIVESKTSKNCEKSMRERANIFKTYNLKKGNME